MSGSKVYQESMYNLSSVKKFSPMMDTNMTKQAKKEYHPPNNLRKIKDEVKQTYGGKENLRKKVTKEKFFTLVEKNETTNTSRMSQNESVTCSMHQMNNVIEEDKDK